MGLPTDGERRPYSKNGFALVKVTFFSMLSLKIWSLSIGHCGICIYMCIFACLPDLLANSAGSVSPLVGMWSSTRRISV